MAGMHLKNHLFMISILCHLGCSKPAEQSSLAPNADGSIQSLHDDHGARAQAIRVTDEAGRPLKARILIGDRGGSPFVGNWFQTDNSGIAAVPPEWVNAQPITFDVNGFVRLTLLDQKPRALSVTLRRLKSSNSELAGLTKGFSPTSFDNKVDFGLLLPAIPKAELLTFTPQLLLSPLNDTISAAGQSIEIPSNLALPKQKETYFVPITLEKPQYRMFFQQEGPKTVFFARGHFPLKEVIGGIQDKKEVFELINLFNFTGGQLRDVNLSGPKTIVDFNVAEMTFSQKTAFKAPLISKDKVMIVFASAEMGENIILSDMKKLESGESTQLNLFTDKKIALIGVLKNKTEFKQGRAGEDRFSAQIASSSLVSMNFLPLVANPTAINSQSFRFDVPNAGDLHPLGMSVLISEKLSSDSAAAEAQQKIWEIRSLNWTAGLALPDLPGPIAQFVSPQRVEVSFVASTFLVEAQSWNDVIQKTTHVTHSSQDF